MKRKWLSTLIVLAMLIPMFLIPSGPVKAVEYYDGIINIVDGTGSGSGWSYSSGQVWINANGSYLINGNGIESTNRIRVSTGVTASVTLDNVVININLPFEVGGTANVTLILLDNTTNSFISSSGHAGIRVQPTASLRITTLGQSVGNGMLTAIGSADSLSHWATAGIGGSELEQNGTIIIDGGTIIAQGGSGRGIYTGGAGIGGAAYRGSGDIIINGGTITAIGGIVGIGGGSSDPEQISGTITINGGNVKAYPGLIAGIGPGIGFCNSIAIDSAANVMAYSSGDYPAIDGITAASGHDAYFLSFMLDKSVSADTGINIENIDDELDIHSFILPNSYRNFSLSVPGANTYKATKSNGSAYLAAIDNSSTEFTGELTPPESAFSGLPVTFIDIPICRIDDTEYITLTAALATAENDDTITLLKDIDYDGQISISHKHLTFDLDGFDLNVTNATGSALDVGIGGKLNLAGEGELIVNGNGYYGHGVHAHDGGEASVTSAYASGFSAIAAYAQSGGIVHVSGNAIGAATGLGNDTYCRGAQADGVDSIVNVGNTVSSANNYGAVAQAAGIVNVGGNVTGHYGGAYVDNGHINIDGNVTGIDQGAYALSGGTISIGGNVVSTGSGGSGAYAVHEGTSITITGDAISQGNYGYGALSGYGAAVNIGADAISTGIDGYGAFAVGPDAIIEIAGNIITENGTGAWASEAGLITIDGTVTAKRYVKLADLFYGIDESLENTTKPGYVTYSDGISTVWIALKQAVNRISGSNRYNTAISVSQSGWDQASVVLLARGDNYADALAGVPLAHQLNAPILLTATSQIGTATMDEIKRLGATNVIILGGTSAISVHVVEMLENEGLTVERIAGTGRYHTAVLIAEYMREKGADFNSSIIAVGTNFPDALAAASYAAIRGEPILLTGSKALALPTKEGIESLGIEDTVVIGGITAISDEVLAELAQYGNTQRISGNNRYSTAVEIAEYYNLDVDHYYIATGLDFPDAITGAVLSAKNGTGVLLVQGPLSLPNLEVRQFVASKGIIYVTLFGGTSVISVGIQNWFIDNL